MPIPGFPDYSRTSSQNSPPLINDSVAFGTGYASAIFDTLGYQYINLSFDTTSATKGYTVFITFATDSGLVQTVYADGFELGPGTKAIKQIVSIARYAQVTAFQSGAAAGDTIKVVAFGTNAQAGISPAENSFGFAYHLFTPVAAGASFTLNNVAPTPGESCLMFFASVSANYFIQMQYLVNGVTANDFAYFYGSHYGQAGTERLILPSDPIGFTVHNTDPGAQNITVNLTILQ